LGDKNTEKGGVALSEYADLLGKGDKALGD